MRRLRSSYGQATIGTVVLAALAAACASSPRSTAERPQTASASGAIMTPAEVARADHGRPPYTPADVHFMQGMIGHHAQAVLMAGWAPSHGARPDVRILAERIDVAQRDEIAMMQRWLRERREEVPDPAAHQGHAGMAMPMMPGMLTAEELAQLDQARGAEFDRLFLTFMIRHHQGALTMVDQLFASPGASQDTDIYRFASDVHVDQITEIERMRTMLSGSSSDRMPSRP